MSDAPFCSHVAQPTLGLTFLLYSLQASFASLFFFPHLHLFPHLKQRKGEEREARQHSPIQELASGEMRVGFNLCFIQHFEELSRGSHRSGSLVGEKK